MVHDINDPQCVGCKNKLLDVHIIMNAWFWWVKENHPEAHVCWGYRGEDDQHADFMAGRSKLDWPNSKHNNMIDDKPCSLALDIFTLDQNGSAKFDLSFYQKIEQETKDAGYKIIWGGSWKSLKDNDHFELEEI